MHLFTYGFSMYQNTQVLSQSSTTSYSRQMKFNSQILHSTAQNLTHIWRNMVTDMQHMQLSQNIISLIRQSFKFFQKPFVSKTLMKLKGTSMIENLYSFLNKYPLVPCKSSFYVRFGSPPRTFLKKFSR